MDKQSRFDTLSFRLTRYGLAIAATLAALAIQLGYPSFYVGAPFLLFYPAVFLSSWRGGFGPGIVSTVLSVLAANYYFIEPLNAFAVREPRAIALMGIFAAMGVLFSAANAQLRNALAREESTHLEKRYLKKSGETVWAQKTVSIVRDDAGEALSIIVVAQDITERKQHEQEMRLRLEEAHRLQTVTAALAEAITPSQVNEAIREAGFVAFGANGGALVRVAGDRETLEVIAFRGYAEEMMEKWKRFPMSVELPLAETARKGEPIFLENLDQIRARYSEGSQVFERNGHLASATLPLIVHGQVIGALGLSFKKATPFKEDTRLFMMNLAGQCAQALERARLYEKAQNAIHVRDEFLSIASHELKTPLTPLKLQLQSLLRTVKGARQGDLAPERIQKLAESSDRQIDRLTHLIEDLLDVSRINAGKLTLNREEICLSDLVEELAERYRTQAAEAGCSLVVSVDPDIIGRLDRIRFEQVIANLLSNAIKYGPGKPIRIELKRKDSQAIVAVQDQGIGIAEEDLERVFDRFERIESDRTVGGLGLGLYISRQIVEAHGGRVWADSRAGSGSVFTVQFPLKDS